VSFRRRIALLAALAVAIAIVIVAAAAWLIVRAELRGQIDDDLTEQAQTAQEVSTRGPFELPLPRPDGAGSTGAGGIPDLPSTPALPPGLIGGPDLGQSGPVGQIVDPDGNVVFSTPRLAAGGGLPTAPAVAALESGEKSVQLEDATVGGVRVRVATAALHGGNALVLARSLEEVNDSLSQLALVMALVAIGGTAAAAGAGTLVARTAMAPARALTATAEEVARTEDLTRRIDVEGDDELGRLGAAFNSMMAALERSVAAQRRLVADASHELRTPLTSLRTNIETLARTPEMPDSERGPLLAELSEEMEELGRLVDDIVDLAREGAETGAAAEPVDVRLDEVAAGCVERARRRAPAATTIEADLQPALVRGAPERLDRAIGNLLDNALKWTPPGGRIEVSADAHGVRVSDSGPGIAEEDLPHVFDRFWRAPSARGTPGSGLGLAIVKQVATTHGGTVAAGRSTLGGARLELALPGTRIDPGLGDA
jgi:two-component system sensor histidine kinase MprB